MKNNDSFFKEYSGVVNNLNNKNVINIMWSIINKIEPEEPMSLETVFALDKNRNFFDNEDKIIKRINTDGHRGADFSNNIGVLFSGCSQTYGQGVEEYAIWGAIVANSLGLSYNNISYRGGSAMQCVYNIFNYCNKYGNPKYILCAFPPLIRSHVFVDSNLLTAKPHDHLLRKRYGSDMGPYRSMEVAENNHYIKMPARVDNVFPDEHKVWINLMFISMLETYCKSNNINLLWTNWIDVYNNKNELMNTKFNNHFTLKENWDQTIHPKETNLLQYNQCHQDIKNNYKNFFDRGADWEYINDDNILGHWGAHTHRHVAENFLEEINKRGL